MTFFVWMIVAFSETEKTWNVLLLMYAWRRFKRDKLSSAYMSVGKCSDLWNTIDVCFRSNSELMEEAVVQTPVYTFISCLCLQVTVQYQVTLRVTRNHLGVTLSLSLSLFLTGWMNSVLMNDLFSRLFMAWGDYATHIHFAFSHRIFMLLKKQQLLLSQRTP